MRWQDTPYTWPLLCAAAITAGLTAYALSRRGVPGAKLFALVSGSLTVWAFSYALELASATLGGQLAWLAGRYAGVVAMPPAWLLFTLQYTGRESWITRGRAVLLGAITLASWLLVATNASHGLFWTDMRLASFDGLLKWTAGLGPAYWINVGWAYLLLTAGNLLVLHALLRSPRIHHGQALSLLLAVGVPWVTNAAHQLGWSPLGFVDPTPPAFTLAMLVMGWALFRYGFLELVPIARDAVIEGMRDAVIVLDPDGRIVDLNPAARHVIGPRAREAIGERCADVLSQWPQMSVISEQGDGPEVVSGEGDAARVFEVRGSALVRSAGSPRGMLLVLSDVTERKRAQHMLALQKAEVEELYERERRLSATLQGLNEMKTNFMIVTSHEMRTPLTVLRGYHDALLGGHIAGEAAREQALAVCNRTVERMAESIEDILEMLRLDQGMLRLDRRPTDLASLARDVVRELHPFVERRKQTLEVDAPADLPHASVDPDKMRQVIHNLVENAIKFTRDGGHITLALAADGHSLRLTVADDGVGVEPSELQRIFERFQTSGDALHHRSGRFEFEARGFGLGLAIVKGHVEAHGGRVWAESAGADTGTRVTVSLPIG